MSEFLITEEIVGAGTLQLHKNASWSIGLSHFRVVRPVHGAVGYWEFDGVADGSSEDVINGLLGRGANRLRLRGATSDGAEVESDAVWASRGPGRSVQGAVHSLTIGANEIVGRIEDQAFEVWFDSSMHATGPGHWSIWSWTRPPLLSTDEQSPLRLQLMGVELTLEWLPARHETTIDGVKVVVEVPRAALRGNVPADVAVQKPTEFFELLLPELDDLCLILGVLSRHWVVWRELRLTSLVEHEGRGPWREARRIKCVSSGRLNTPREMLVEPSKLGERALERMLVKLRELPYAETARICAAYLVEALSTNSLPYAILTGFVALEALVNAMSASAGEEFTLGGSDFSALQKELQACIRLFATTRNLGKETRQRLYAKLGELRRPPIIPRIAAVLLGHDVHVDDLWAHDPWYRELPVADRLSDMYGRRSELFHAGKVTDPDLLRLDFQRVHAICERLLFALLGGSPTEISALAYSRFRVAEANSRVRERPKDWDRRRMTDGPQSG